MEIKMTYRVPYADTDRMGVVYYANYLVYFERARNELLREAGMTYGQLEETGFMLPVIEAACKYRDSARYDDILTFTARVDYMKGVRVKIDCEVTRDNVTLVTGHTVHACVNSSGKACRLPEAFIKLFAHKLETTF
jgi:acyl-CoA thioester hydrolase